MNKSFSLGIAGVIVGAIIVAAFALVSFSEANGPFVNSAITANVSTTTSVGPQTNIQILASSSRSYAAITTDNPTIAVYCNANGDIAASATIASFKLGTTTPMYEFSIEKNPYDGAIRCHASASTTLIVYELKRN